jgi:hypothetical protein
MGVGGGGVGGMGVGGMGAGGMGGAGGSMGCGANEKLCGTICVAIDDPAYGCDLQACSPCVVANATAVCAAGACAIGQCQLGFGDCDTQAATGCEVDLSTAANCGACGNACAPAAACQTLGACDPQAQQCAYTPIPDGSACSDNDACTQSDACQSGACVGSSPVTCVAQDQCHDVGLCDPMTGACSNPEKPDGALCDDADDCTIMDACQSGACAGSLAPAGTACTAQPNAVMECDASGACVIASCEAGFGDCDSSPASGCEADLALPSDCGACGNVCQSGVCGESLSALTGSPPGVEWVFNGSATYDAGAQSAVLVAAGQTFSAGTVIYQTPIAVDTVEVSFELRFEYVGGNNRGDGLGFMIHQNGPNAIGGLGNGLGMAGLNGYGVELDITDSFACGDQNGNHAAIDQLSPVCSGALPNPIAVSPDLYDNGQPGGGIGDIADGQWRTVIVSIMNGEVSVMISGQAVPLLQNIALPGFVSGTPYSFGFSGATGAAAARHEIRNVSIAFANPHCL